MKAEIRYSEGINAAVGLMHNEDAVEKTSQLVNPTAKK